MLSGNDYTFGLVPPSTPLHIRRIPVDESWPAAPGLPPADRCETRTRMLRTLDGIETPAVLLHPTGEIVAVNRIWRMTAKMQGMRHGESGVGLNYLMLCGAAAAEGDCDAAITAEGVDGVLQGRCRSFFYKYRIVDDRETRLYALLAWRMEEAGAVYVAVSHELLEVHGRV